jgi:hypothetical protein
LRQFAVAQSHFDARRGGELDAAGIFHKHEKLASSGTSRGVSKDKSGESARTVWRTYEENDEIHQSCHIPDTDWGWGGAGGARH